ncbi:MAG: putative bifunctional diguanylate cyclase/phosphodiesterase [Mycolicibacterium sp.]|uniref:putative bifunctional diguanylate cyclase/phosphodiesterase n=1 Tax=Mycolicibacterium sp. TaxID=2320850 RepID=UPI003D12A310
MSDTAWHANRVRPSLGLVVTSAASQLMAATAATAVEVSRQVMSELTAYLGVDRGFLRYNDHFIGASRLIAEYPVRTDVPHPDPLALVFFAAADPVLSASEHAKRPIVHRPEPAGPNNQAQAPDVAKMPDVSKMSVAAAPLISGDITTGVLGFAKSGDRSWESDELDALQTVAALFAQVQARVHAEEQLRHLAERDDLTGLLNRRTLLAHLDARLTAGQPGPVAVLFFDLDRIKVINDYVGHQAGDVFIRVAADRLRNAADPSAVIARIGGDEFVLVAAGPMGTTAAEILANRLRTALRDGVTIDDELLSRTVSIGVAEGIPGRDNTTDLIRRAVQAVNAAKASGGNSVSVFSADMWSKNAFRNDIELHLQGVIDDGALHLQYLPEVDLRTGQIVGAEALVRWRHPTRGLLSPDSFISIAESINLAVELGRWVMRTACAELAGWRSRGAGRGTVLRVNVSPVQLVTHGFVDSVADIMNEFALDRGSICLEITERVVVEDIETTRITLAALQDAGVRVAIDDFGTGYSALSQLKTLRVDTLKIDQGFVRELGSDPNDLTIVRAIIALAEAFDLELVAEGVETPAAARTLLAHGCQRAQGYLLSPPVGATEMESLLAQGRIPLRF